MKGKIRTRAFVQVNGEYVDVDTLSPELRKVLAERLATTWFNTMYAGRAVFTPAGKEKG